MSSPHDPRSESDIQSSLIISRKSDHLRLAMDAGSQFAANDGFESWHFEHQALPEIDFDEINLNCQLFGKSLKAPLLIASMTGGPEQGAKINQNLAQAAQTLGLGMGLGSMRVIFDQPETLTTFQVRDVAPDILLLANLGAVQLNKGFSEWHCREVVKQVQADGLYLHLNPLQEAIQPEGDTSFRNLTEHIAEACSQLEFPVLAKECGNGLSARSAKRLIGAGIQGLEVSGRGGTSWAWIEAQRQTDIRRQRLGRTFAHWGLSTPDSLLACREVANETPLIASGGIRSGLDMAKALALGADAVSIAQPLLKAALESPAAVIQELELFLLELKITMFCVGARNLTELKKIPLHKNQSASQS